MKLSSPTINDSNHEWMKLFKAGVEARSKGKVKVEMYPANQLGQIPATVDGVALGTIEFRCPFMDATRLPLYYAPLHYLLAGLVALAASAIAGYLPARKAASLQPVEIIRGAS